VLTAEARAWIAECGGSLHVGPIDPPPCERPIVVDGHWTVPCGDCGGCGLVPLPDYTEWFPCVPCKGTGDTIVALAAL
jgi:hypothetical protein